MAEPGDKRVFIHTVDVNGNITAVNNERGGVDVLDEAAVNLAAQHKGNTNKDSGLLRTYLGDWHSHPHGKLTLSRKDKRTLLRIAKFPPARAPQPLMVVAAGPPWQMRIWKTDKIRLFSFKLDTSECETIEY